MIHYHKRAINRRCDDTVLVVMTTVVLIISVAMAFAESGRLPFPKGEISLIAGQFTKLNFGLVDFVWEVKPSPLVTLKVIDENGRTGVSQTVHLEGVLSRKAADEQEVVSCPKPRPQFCIQDYQPVCAKLDDGTVKTYSNGCNACADPAVIGYREGACE